MCQNAGVFVLACLLEKLVVSHNFDMMWERREEGCFDEAQVN